MPRTALFVRSWKQPSGSLLLHRHGTSAWWRAWGRRMTASLRRKGSAPTCSASSSGSSNSRLRSGETTMPGRRSCDAMQSEAPLLPAMMTQASSSVLLSPAPLHPRCVGLQLFSRPGRDVGAAAPRCGAAARWAGAQQSCCGHSVREQGSRPPPVQGAARRAPDCGAFSTSDLVCGRVGARVRGGGGGGGGGAAVSQRGCGDQGGGEAPLHQPGP